MLETQSVVGGQPTVYLKVSPKQQWVRVEANAFRTTHSNQQLTGNQSGFNLTERAKEQNIHAVEEPLQWTGKQKLDQVARKGQNYFGTPAG